MLVSWLVLDLYKVLYQFALSQTLTMHYATNDVGGPSLGLAESDASTSTLNNVNLQGESRAVPQAMSQAKPGPASVATVAAIQI